MYLMSFHREPEQAGYLAVSDDLKNWRDLNGGKPVIAFSQEHGKIVRDPHVFRTQDGVFHMLFTDNWRGHTIGHTWTRELERWPEENIEFLDLMGGTAVENCWAPECVFDQERGRWLVFWSSRLAGEEPRHDRMYCATTVDFRQWSPARLFFDPGFSVIDLSIKRWNGRYWMMLKDERGDNKDPEHAIKALRACSAYDAEGPYGPITGLLTHSFCEGPTIIRLQDRFAVLYDDYRRFRYGALETADFVTFTEAGEHYGFPKGCKHATVIEL